jgi:8-oxo-dGTP pyrophosphatase MutT (NUDIX family)
VTRITPGVVDVAVVRRVGGTWRVLTLQRGPGTRSTGAWEIVHGTVEPGETPVQAALRELREETGLAAERLYSITVNPFYLPRHDTVQLAVAFAAVVRAARFQLGPEHARGRWETFTAARRRLAWPRSHELLRHIAWILRTGNAGPVEDVLRVR